MDNPSRSEALAGSERRGGAREATTSIASRLLRIIFGSYFLFTLLVTVIQLAAAYRHTETQVDEELAAMRQTFGPGIADAMWRFQNDVLHGIVSGMKELPVVVGVKILDENGGIVGAVGTVLDEHGARMQGAGGTSLKPLAEPEGFLSRTFGKEFPIVYTDEAGRQREIGKWAVYSDRQVIIRQVQYGFILIIVSAVLNATALWFIFLFVVRRWLGQPLTQLSDFVRQLNIDNLGERPFVLKDRSRHELHFLADALNNTTSKLRGSIEKNTQLYRELQQEQLALRELNETLEQRVARRTAELQDANLQLEALSLTDSLTGVGNRRHLDNVLLAEWRRAQRMGQPLALALLDVDWFKSFNDCYGHQAGDDCLRVIARVLATQVRRSGDVVARYGGEEFAIVAPGLDEEGALALAELLRAAVEAEAIEHAHSPMGRVTASIGVVSVVPGTSVAPETILKRVDEALYEAKARGRNRVLRLKLPFA